MHLSPLKRQGIIGTWHDRRISAGQELNHTISQELEAADIILLLVSSYFINSDYCHDVEMARAMERHKQGEARVIPVILRPCEWQPIFGKILAVPEDGKAITKFADLHEGFLQVAQAIRRVAGEIGSKRSQDTVHALTTAAVTVPAATQPHVRSSNLRVKKTFSDHEQDGFREETFEYLARFFEGSLDEVHTRNPDTDARFRRIDANHFTAVAYRDGIRAAECKIWIGGQHAFGGDIVFSYQIDTDDNSFNESLHIENDGYTLYLKPIGMSFMRERPESEQLTQQGAAEYLWSMFISNLQ